MTARVFPGGTRSPGRSRIRRNLPASGDETTYRSRRRVFPSSSTHTCRLPTSTRATSTGTGLGRKAYTTAPTRPSTSKLAMILLIQRFTTLLLPRLQNGDEIEVIQPPPDDQPRKHRRDQNDCHRKAVGRRGDHERNAVD